MNLTPPEIGLLCVLVFLALIGAGFWIHAAWILIKESKWGDD